MLLQFSVQDHPILNTQGHFSLFVPKANRAPVNAGALLYKRKFDFRRCLVMKYILKTEINSKGINVFCKERNGKSFTYFAKDDLNNICKVDKKWILSNQIDILNLGVGWNESLYPATNLRKRKKLPYGMVRCEACGEVVWEQNSDRFHKSGTNEDITICDNCDMCGHEGYVSCRGCDIPCWKKSNELYEVAGSGHSDYENLVCDEYLEYYNYCKNCEVYYHKDDGECPRCRKW